MYQNGQFAELLSLQGSGLLKNVKTAGTLTKTYEKEIKSYILLLDNNSSKLQFPKDEKDSLSLINPFFIMQLFLIPEKPFNLEIIVSDKVKVNH